MAEILQKNLFRYGIITFVALIFIIDIPHVVTVFFGATSSYHQKAISTAFMSTFGIFELVLFSIMFHFFRKYPARRVRLISVLACHIILVMIIPMVMHDHSWMGLSYPWPQTLIAFDRSTPYMVMVASLIIGFAITPIVTLLWGRKAFCGYVCPQGAFYSESLGRLFHPKPGRFPRLRRYGPLVYFTLMLFGLVSMLLLPQTHDTVRSLQKVMFFFVPQVLYLVVGIPLVGARSYCTHLCPLGFELRLMLKMKKALRRKGMSGSKPA